MSTVLFSVRRRDLSWAVALIVLLSAIWVARSDIADAGAIPPGDGIAVVYIGVGTNFPDSLGVGPGAGANSAPIIILPTNPPIPANSEAELVRLDPKTVIIVGGTGVISTAMEDAIEALLPNTAVSRIAGANRYDTNAAFSAATFPIEGWASVPGADFRVENSDQLTGGIQLPHGAEILGIEAGVFDGRADDSYTVDLSRVDKAVNTAVIASAETALLFAGGVTTISDSTITPGTEIVDNETYSYYFVVSSEQELGMPLGNIVTVMVHYRLGAPTG